jgi:hypothetical protein
MPYTFLSMIDRGVVLCDYHLRRLELEPGSGSFDDFARFACEARPGAWALWVDDPGGLRVERRPGTRLRDGIPVRRLPSPLDPGAGLIPKPGLPAEPYARLRQDGVATLLTSADGSEIYEACSAAVLGWDGASLVVPPLDRPRVWSTTEHAIRDHTRVVEAPIPSQGMPILLANAVKGACTVSAPECGAFPPLLQREIDGIFASLTKRPLDARS